MLPHGASTRIVMFNDKFEKEINMAEHTVFIEQMRIKQQMRKTFIKQQILPRILLYGIFIVIVFVCFVRYKAAVDNAEWWEQYAKEDSEVFNNFIATYDAAKIADAKAELKELEENEEFWREKLLEVEKALRTLQSEQRFYQNYQTSDFPRLLTDEQIEDSIEIFKNGIVEIKLTLEEIELRKLETQKKYKELLE